MFLVGSLVLTGCSNNISTNEQTKSNENTIADHNQKAAKEQGNTNTNSNEKVVSKEPKTSKEKTGNNQGSKSSSSTTETTSNSSVTTKETTSTESISFNTIKKNDSSLEKGKTIVVQEGQNGARTITYKETYKDGKLTSKEKISSEVTKQPVDKIIKVGTKVTQSTGGTIDIHNLFQMRTGAALTSQQRSAAYNESKNDTTENYYCTKIDSVYGNYIQGTFDWDYRNKNNRNNFLAWRGGNYWYDNKSLSASKLYDEIYQKVQSHKLVIIAKISYSRKDTFIQPTHGGYTVYGVLSIKYHSDNGSTIKGYKPDTWYSVRYEPEFDFKTLSKTDTWSRWTGSNPANLLSVSFQYRVGNF